MSGTRFLIDTCTLIGLQKRSEESLALLYQHDASIAECAISLVTYIEFVGFHGVDEHTANQLNNIASGFLCLPISDDITQKTIKLRQTHKIKLPDSIILATAQVHGLQLLTLDNKLHRFFGS